MAELVILVTKSKDVKNPSGLQMKSTLEKMRLKVLKIVRKETEGEGVLKEDLVILITQNRLGVLNGLKVKSTLEGVGLKVLGVVTKETDGNTVPKELIGSLMKIKVIDIAHIDE